MIFDDEFNIPGKGHVLVIRLEPDEPCPTVGHRVNHKGCSYEVVAAERFNKPMSVPIPSNNIAIIVRRLDTARIPQGDA